MPTADRVVLADSLLQAAAPRSASNGWKGLVPLTFSIGLCFGVGLLLRSGQEVENEDPAVHMAAHYMQAAKARQQAVKPVAGAGAWHPTQRARSFFSPLYAEPARGWQPMLQAREQVAAAAVNPVTPAAAAASASEKVLATGDARFITEAAAKKIQSAVGTPAYVYDEATLVGQADKALAFPNAYGLTVRFAMKAAPNKQILKLFNAKGLHIDASSGFECHRAMQAGFPASHMSLSTQEFPSDFKELYEKGIEFNACSLSQLESFGKLFPGGKCGVRFNPGTGSGGTGKTNVGGPSSSFGIWYELLPEVQNIVAKYNLNVIRIHTHIGSGSDPSVWQKVSTDSINLCKPFPNVHTLNLGGGYKVGRMPGEVSTDLQNVGAPVVGVFEKFAQETGRKLKLEIEPGTFLVANSAALLTGVQDIVTTGDTGYTFLKFDSGMTDVLRPSLYGAQHPITVFGEPDKEQDYVVVGHCCESGDLFSCKPGAPEELDTRTLRKAAIGDLAVIDGSGAYCSSMSTKNYNSFPEAPEVLLKANGDVKVIRNKQTLEQMLANEQGLD